MTLAEKVYLHSLARKEASDGILAQKVADDPVLNSYYAGLVSKVASDPSYLQKEAQRLLNLISDCDEVIAKCASDIYALKVAGIDSKRNRKNVREQINRRNEAVTTRNKAKERLEIIKTFFPDSTIVVDEKDPSKFYDLSATGSTAVFPKHGRPSVNINGNRHFLGDLPAETSPSAVTAVLREGGPGLNGTGLNPSQVKKMQAVTGVINPNLSYKEMMDSLKVNRVKGTDALTVGDRVIDATKASNSTRRKFKEGAKNVLNSKGIERFGQTGNSAAQTDVINNVKEAITRNQVKADWKRRRDVDRAVRGLLDRIRNYKTPAGLGDRLNFGALKDVANRFAKTHGMYDEIAGLAGKSKNALMTGADAKIINAQRELAKHLRTLKYLKRGGAVAGGLAALGTAGYGGYKWYDNTRPKSMLDRVRDALGVA